MRAITLTWASPVLLGNNHLLFLTGGKREVALVKRTQPIKSSKWQVCSWLYQFLPQFLQVGWSLVKPTFLYGTIGIGIPSSQSYFNKDKGRSSNDLAWCISKLLLRNKVAQTQELKKKKGIYCCSQVNAWAGNSAFGPDVAGLGWAGSCVSVELANGLRIGRLRSPHRHAWWVAGGQLELLEASQPPAS